jgi:hypothetical protein
MNRGEKTVAIDFVKGGVSVVADGAFVYVGPEGDSNNGIVLTDEGTISIDSYSLPETWCSRVCMDG